MGIFDKALEKAKAAFDKAKCFAGSHDFYPWSYASPTSCIQTRICNRSGCLETESRTEHDWPRYKYVSENSCHQERQCRRCKEKEVQTLHASWGEWSYFKADDCEMSRECARCKEVAKTIEHIWEVWAHESPTSCAQVRFCRRCNHKERKEPTEKDHQWSEPRRLNCQFEKIICAHCKKERTNSLIFQQHVWGPWRQSNPYSDQQERRCNDCGLKEERSEA